MKLERAEVEDFRTSALRERAEIAKRSDDGAHLFRVVSQDGECGFVALDLPAGERGVELREILILPGARGRGLGSTAMNLIEHFARGQNRTTIWLWAHPIDDDEDFDLERLIGWYTKLGFVRRGIAGDELQKVL